jgi:hypothetical protein
MTVVSARRFAKGIKFSRKIGSRQFDTPQATAGKGVAATETGPFSASIAADTPAPQEIWSRLDVLGPLISAKAAIVES